MAPPRLVECTCGHLGQQHHDDGRCGRCECAKFTHPVHRHVPDGAGVHLSRKPTKARRRVGWSPTRDAR